MVRSKRDCRARGGRLADARCKRVRRDAPIDALPISAVPGHYNWTTIAGAGKERW
jgi:hypothetical protein